MPSRRKFIRAGLLGAGALTATASSNTEPKRSAPAGEPSLCGEWLFRTDPDGSGEQQRWHDPHAAEDEWRKVCVPHTWQTEPELCDYYGVAWYRRAFEANGEWRDSAVRVEFEAVFHTATVWVNGLPAGDHLRKGYTAFTLDITRLLHFGQPNSIAVRVDNAFNEHMLPRGHSSDWAHDGGIYRPVQLIVTPQVFIERVEIEADPDLSGKTAALQVSVAVHNTSKTSWNGHISYFVRDEDGGNTVVKHSNAAALRLAPGEVKPIALPASTIPDARLWHFDNPHLYEIAVELSGSHAIKTTFGIRKIETRAGGFFLNGERVRLMGPERMAGSNPKFGMAEPAEWIAHDHADLKTLNCVYTRVHWQQDRRVLDWCDRHGILIQTEVPTWGSATFKGMEHEPSADIMDNGLEQLREMIDRDRNHPCIFSWGVCNEINGQNPPAYEFAKRMYLEAKRLNPTRLVSYASNSLQKTPEKDVSGLMDYIMWNEYYESWYPGTVEDMARNLEEIHRAFPEKAIVISEYGYCACTADRPEGDAKRIEVLREHDRVFRDHDYVAGLIFFCYNDYRTHIGDRGTAVCKQRVHGVVDLYGTPKPSWKALRRESSPIQSVQIEGKPARLSVAITARGSVPAYPLHGYSVRGVAFGFGQIPVEQIVIPLNTVQPGETTQVQFKFTQNEIARIEVDVMRPTGYSAWSEQWHY